jgi:hypothetical protein
MNIYIYIYIYIYCCLLLRLFYVHICRWKIYLFYWKQVEPVEDYFMLARQLTALYICWQGTLYTQIHQGHLEIISIRRDIGFGVYVYSRVSFCDGSLLRPLSNRTEHSRLVVHHCRNSSVLSLLSALLALFPCACVSSFSILVQFFEVDCDFSTHDDHQKDRKEGKTKTVDARLFLDVFWTTAWAFFNRIKSDLIHIFSIICVIFFIPNSLI